jgi:hypothetical protein
MTDQVADSIASASTVSGPLPDAASARCENCDAPLQGHYCHACGQSTHSPVRHAGHAIEEVFESFWHLDGRVFRTLRDLMVPGRVALGYLAGHRVCYIAPLRLFVILSVLTFFVGKLAVHFETEPDTTASADIAAITAANTVEEVKQEQDRLLAEIGEARREIANNAPIPGLDAVMIREEIRIRGEAGNRIAQLQRKGAASAADADAAKEGAATPPAPAADAVDASPATEVRTGPDTDPEWEGPLFSTDSEAWDPEKSPVRIGWLPDFANRWLTGRMVNARDNIKRMEGRPDLWFQVFMSSLPSALFLLVPVFALLLKAAYLFKRRFYLEHMVVALYSHCFLLLALAAVFLLTALGGAAAGALPWLTGMASLTICLWMPIYLLLMQKRVYGQGWPMTLLKYLVIGYIYFFLLSLAAGVMFVATLAKSL